MVAIISTIVLHSAVVLLASYLFLVFAWWWWYESKSATSIYKYTCYLMFGISFTHAGAVWLYLEKLIQSDLDLNHFVPDWWAFRIAAMVIPLLLYAIHVTKKIYKENRRNHQERGNDRRTHSRRSSDQLRNEFRLNADIKSEDRRINP